MDRKQSRQFFIVAFVLIWSVIGRIFCCEVEAQVTLSDTKGGVSLRELLEAATGDKSGFREKLNESFSSSDQRIRYAAAKILLKNQEEIPKIKRKIINNLLSDRNYWVRELAIQILGEFASAHFPNFADPQTLDIFLNLVNDPNPSIRLSAINQLKKWLPENKITREVVEMAIEDDVWIVRQVSEFPNFNIDEEKFLNSVTKAIKDELPFLRVKSIRAIEDFLLKYRHAKYYRSLQGLVVKRLGDRNPQVIYETILFLEKLGEPKDVGPLLRLYYKNRAWESDVRRAIKKITGQCLEKFSSKRRGKRDALPLADIHYKNELDHELKSLAKGSEVEKVSAALRLTWVTNNVEAVEALRKSLLDPSILVQRAAVFSLTNLSNDPLRNTNSVFEDLIKLTTIKNNFVREQAYQAMGNYWTGKRRKVAIGLLAKALKEEADPFVRLSVVTSLSSYPVKETSSAMVAGLLDNFYVIRKIAVGRINLNCHLEIVPLVIPLLSDQSSDVRIATLRTLAPLADILKDIEKENNLRRKIIRGIERLVSAEKKYEIKSLAEVHLQNFLKSQSDLEGRRLSFVC